MDPKEELQATLAHLRALDKKLDEYERTHDKALLAYVQDQVKQMGPQLKTMIQNPAFKSPDNSENFLELRDAMKNVIKRAKTLNEQTRTSNLQSESVVGGGGGGGGGVGRTRRRGSDADQNPVRVGDAQASASFNPSTLSSRHSSTDRRKSGFQDGSGDKYTPGMVIDLNEKSPDLIDMRTKPQPVSGWMKKQGEDLFKGWKRRYFLQKQWRIEYFKSDKVTSAEPLGHIDISSLRKINIVRDPKFSFHLETEFRLYILQAESQADLERIVFGLVQWRSHFLYENASDKKAFSESARPISATPDSGVSPRPYASQAMGKDRGENDSIRNELVQMFSKAKVERSGSPASSSNTQKGNSSASSNLSLAISSSREEQVVSPVRNLDYSANYERKISKPVGPEGGLPRQLSITSMERAIVSPATPSRMDDQDKKNPFGEKISTSSNPFGDSVPSSAGNPFGEKVSAAKSNPFVEPVTSPNRNPFGETKPPVVVAAAAPPSSQSNPFGENTSPPGPNPFSEKPAPSAGNKQLGEKVSTSAVNPFDDSKNWKNEHDKVLRELTFLRDKHAQLEKEANDYKRQIALLSDAQRMQREAKVELEAALEAQNEERKKKRQLEEELAAMQTRFDIERRNWKEERHKAEEEAASFRREKASLTAEQRSLEEEIARLRAAASAVSVTQTEKKTIELKKPLTETSASPSRNPFGDYEDIRAPSPSPSSSSSSSVSRSDSDELLKMAAELKAAREQEKEEKRMRREAEQVRDEMKKQLEIEVSRREKEETRRKEEFLSLKAEMDKDRKKMQDMRDELDQEKRSRQLEEKKRAANAISRAERVEKGGALQPPYGIADFEEIERMMNEANLSPAQYDAVIQRIKIYLEKYCPSSDEFSDLEEHISSLIEELSIANGKAAESKKELSHLLSEYGTREKYISSLRSQLEANQPKAKGNEGGAKGNAELVKQIEKWRETAEAHEMQSSVLGKQIEVLTAENAVEIKAKDDTIETLRKELRSARKALRELAEMQMLQSGVTQSDLNALEEVKRELFFTLAIFTKQNLAESGIACNVNLSDLFEEAKDMDFHQWRHWIQSRLNTQSGHVPRSYSATISGKGMETIAPDSGKRSTEKKSSGGNMSGTSSSSSSSRPVGVESGGGGGSSVAVNRPKGKGKGKARTVEIK